MKLVLRRAEPADVDLIRLLVSDISAANGPALLPVYRKRFGNTNIALLIDAAQLSIVATDVTEKIILGFCAFTNGPPILVDEAPAGNPDKAGQGIIASGSWDQWVRVRFETKDVRIPNTKFLSFFASAPEHQVAFLDAALSTMFSLLPAVKNICYFLPSEIPLFPPFNSPKFQPQNDADREGERKQPHSRGGFRQFRQALRPNALRRRGKHNHHGLSDRGYFKEVPAKETDAKYLLHVCHRRDVFPTLKVRRARVEDCDDLVPMFKKQHLSHGKKADHYLAELLESKDESIKNFVAEVDGDVVGFMSLTNNIDQSVLIENYDLSTFDNFRKDVPTPEEQQTAEDSSNDDGSLLEKSNELSDQPVDETVDVGDTDLQSLEATRALREQPNIFCITLLCIEDAYANQAVEFVRAAFAVYTDRDYCVATVPTHLPEIPVFRHFSRIPSMPGKLTSHCLFVANRFGLGDHISVRRGKHGDIVTVEEFVRGLAVESELMPRLKLAVNKPPDVTPGTASFIAECAGQLVGVATLEQCLEPDMLTDQFDVEEHLSLSVVKLKDEYVIIRHFLLNPLFSHQASWFLEEIMRISAVSCLIYPVDENSKVDTSTRLLMSTELVPVRRRQQIVYKENLRDGIPVIPPLEFNIQLITSSMLYEPKIAVNTRIVVVGGSDVGIAFLEKLIYSPHLSFPNLTLVSIGGLPQRSEDSQFVDHLCFSPTELKQIGLDHYIPIIRSSTIEFDRVLKRIKLNNGSFVMYDYLFLTPGVQFSASAVSEAFESLINVVNLSQRNALSIDAGLMKASTVEAKPVVIYGCDLQVYATLRVAAQKVQSSNIVLILPPLRTPSTCFDNGVVEEKVHQELRTLGVRVMNGYKLVNWTANTSNHLSSITLWSKAEARETKIDDVELFLYGDTKSVDPDSFRSINDSCLVFDGRLVIDKYFRTQDPYIYAAGSITKYSSKYQTKWTHAYYDSKEVGCKLAEIVMPLFDPTSIPTALVDDYEVVQFRGAKKVHALLPNDLNYFHFDEPRLPSHTLDFRKRQKDYGRDLVTDDPENGYFRIHVDLYGFIKSVTYLGKRSIPISNYLCLYNLHEQYLNRLIARFDEGIVNDFVSFFEEAWAFPIFHDRFKSFMQQMRLETLESTSSTVVNVTTRLKDLILDGSKIEDEEREDLYQRITGGDVKKSWDAQAFEFFLATKVCDSFP